MPKLGEKAQGDTEKLQDVQWKKRLNAVGIINKYLQQQICY